MTGPRSNRLPAAIDLESAVARAVELFSEAAQGLVLIGGAALQAFGITRATRDVEFAVTRAGSAAIERLARERGLDVSPLRIGGVSVDLGEVRGDFIDRRHEVECLFVEAIEQARRAGFLLQAGSRQVLVVPLEYLVALKVVGVRPQDEADVAALLRIRSLDYPAAREVVERRLGGVAARYLDKAAREAGRADAPRAYDDDGAES